jgi:hypothetical protein
MTLAGATAREELFNSPIMKSANPIPVLVRAAGLNVAEPVKLNSPRAFWLPNWL